MLKLTKKHATQAIVIMSVATLGCQIASATVLDKFTTDGWIQFANDDGVYTNGFVDPGWGGQDFDAEYLYYKLAGNKLSIGLQSGFDLNSGLVVSGGRNYYAGDLALSFDGDTTLGDASTYEFAFDFGLLTKDYDQNFVGDPTDGIDDSGLYQVTAWNENIHFDLSNPFAMEQGSLATNGETLAGQDGDSYWRTVSFDTSSLSDFAGFDAHWTMSCGNDAIDGHAAPAPVPEPATMLLFSTGLAGLAGFTRKRKK